MERGICPIAAVSEFARYCCHGHVTLATPTLETFVRSHVGTIPGNTPAKFEVRIFSHFETIAFNAQTFTGSRDRDHAHFFGNICQVSRRDYPWEHHHHHHHHLLAHKQTVQHKQILEK